MKDFLIAIGFVDITNNYFTTDTSSKFSLDLQNLRFEVTSRTMQKPADDTSKTDDKYFITCIQLQNAEQQVEEPMDVLMFICNAHVQLGQAMVQQQMRKLLGMP
jgi:hypothetical protein